MQIPGSCVEGDKILVHRHLRALLKHLGNTLQNFRHRCTENTIEYNTTTFFNVPTVKGHFGMMCKTYTTIRPSNEFTCLCIEAVCLLGVDRLKVSLGRTDLSEAHQL